MAVEQFPVYERMAEIAKEVTEGKDFKKVTIFTHIMDALLKGFHLGLEYGELEDEVGEITVFEASEKIVSSRQFPSPSVAALQLVNHSTSVPAPVANAAPRKLNKVREGSAQAKVLNHIRSCEHGASLADLRSHFPMIKPKTIEASTWALRKKGKVSNKDRRWFRR